MLVTSKQMILDAQKGGYAIGSFNTSDLEMTRAIVFAAAKLNAPVMVETSEKAIAYAGLEELASVVIELAKKVKIPVALHLDHGSNLDVINKCLNVGYTSVMLDGSKLPFQENIAVTRAAAQMAHKKNVPCEGELGVMKKTGEEKSYTDANEVAEFVRKTGVNFLAVAIGSAHGVGGDEKLNIDLLKTIHLKTLVPLVLHGASGVSEEDIKDAIKNGICKINIDTDIRHTFAKSIRDMAKKNLDDPRDIMQEVMKDIQKLIEEKIKLFGSDGKA